MEAYYVSQTVLSAWPVTTSSQQVFPNQIITILFIQMRTGGSERLTNMP